jgi:hypothetical protein
MVVAVLLGSVTLGGCATEQQVVAPLGTGRGAIAIESQRALEEFADRYMTAMADAYDKVRQGAPTPEGAYLAIQLKLQIGLGAINNATSPSPLAGLTNMAVLVTLVRTSTEGDWAREAFGEQGVATLLSAARPLEDDVWSLLASRLTAEQVQELRGLISRWSADHPGARYVAGARVEAFMRDDSPASRTSLLPNSLYDLFGLDPLAGLDPAIREVEQSRMIAERLFFYTRHASVLLSWQAEMLYVKALEAPEVKQLLGDTGRFTDATKEFANASSQVAGSVERFRADLATQQATLVAQVDDLITRQREAMLTQSGLELSAQRDAALKQAGEEIAVQRDAAFKQASIEIGVQRDAALQQAAGIIAKERDAAIVQLNASVTNQQSLLAASIRSVVDDSIDRIYVRARSLVLILAGSVLSVIVVYSFILAPLRKRILRGPITP